jgi:hypothetical protein
MGQMPVIDAQPARHFRRQPDTAHFKKETLRNPAIDDVDST